MSIPSFNLEDLLQWEREHRDAVAQRAELDVKIDILARKIDAGRILFGEHESVPTSQREGLSTTPETLETWRDLVLYALSRATGGRTQAQILAAAKDTAMEERARKSPNGVYVKVKAMQSSGDIIRDGQHFYLPELWAAIQRGEVHDDREEVTANKGSIQQTVLALMRDGKPHRAKEIEAALRENPATARQVRTGGAAYVYTLLSRMYRNERLDKVEDGVYVLREENEPPAKADGSDVGGAGTLPFENVVDFGRPR